jgi:hypothetical protein
MATVTNLMMGCPTSRSGRMLCFNRLGSLEKYRSLLDGVSLPEVLQTSPYTLSGHPDFPERPAIDWVARNAHRRCGRAVEALAVEHECSGRNLGQVKLPLIMGTQFTAGRHSYTLGYPVASGGTLPSRCHLDRRKVQELPQNIIFRDIFARPTRRNGLEDVEVDFYCGHSH